MTIDTNKIAECDASEIVCICRTMAVLKPLFIDYCNFSSLEAIKMAQTLVEKYGYHCVQKDNNSETWKY